MSSNKMNNASRLSKVSFAAGSGLNSAIKKKQVTKTGIQGQIAEVNTLIKQMKQYSSHIKVLIKGEEEDNYNL